MRAAHGRAPLPRLCAASDASGVVRRGETPTQSVLAQLLQPDTPGNSTGTPVARDLTEALAALASDKRLMSTFQVSRTACLLQCSWGCTIVVHAAVIPAARPAVRVPVLGLTHHQAASRWICCQVAHWWVLCLTLPDGSETLPQARCSPRVLPASSCGPSMTQVATAPAGDAQLQLPRSSTAGPAAAAAAACPSSSVTGRG